MRGRTKFNLFSSLYNTHTHTYKQKFGSHNFSIYSNKKWPKTCLIHQIFVCHTQSPLILYMNIKKTVCLIKGIETLVNSLLVQFLFDEWTYKTPCREFKGKLVITFLFHVQFSTQPLISDSTFNMNFCQLPSCLQLLNFPFIYLKKNNLVLDLRTLYILL